MLRGSRARAWTARLCALGRVCSFVRVLASQIMRDLSLEPEMRRGGVVGLVGGRARMHLTKSVWSVRVLVDDDVVGVLLVVDGGRGQT